MRLLALALLLAGCTQPGSARTVHPVFDGNRCELCGTTRTHQDNHRDTCAVGNRWVHHGTTADKAECHCW